MKTPDPQPLDHLGAPWHTLNAAGIDEAGADAFMIGPRRRFVARTDEARAHNARARQAQRETRERLRARRAGRAIASHDSERRADAVSAASSCPSGCALADDATVAEGVEA